MDIFSLLQGKLEELESVQVLFENKDYISLYSRYNDVLKGFLFIETLEEFGDFIEEQGELETESFLLALASKKNICCSIGMYESNASEILQQYLQKTSESTISAEECDDNYKFLVMTLSEINQEISTGEYILLIDDAYCEGVFYIFYIPEREGLEEWSNTKIERLV